MLIRCSRSLVPMVLVLAALVTGQAWANEGAKLEKPKKVLKSATKALSKTKGYEVEFKRSGGFLKGSGPFYEQVGTPLDYDVKVYGKLLEFSEPKAFKSPKGGAIREAGSWRRILATKEGAKMGRIVDFPTMLLADALRYGKDFEWVGSTDKDAASDKGRTAVTETQYNTIRVKLPAKVAMNYANTLDSAG